MFCINCGAAVNGEVLAACANCGKAAAPSTLTGADVTRVIKEASSDALTAIRQVAVDPVAGLASSFASLGEQRARSAGAAFGVGFALLSALAAVMGASKLGSESNLKVFVGMFVLALVPFVAIAAISAGARKALGGNGTVAGDLFTAGVALQPIGVFFVLAAILGVANYQAVGVLSLFAWTYMLCILFTGSTRLAGLPERFAPPAVAVMLLAAIWLTKIASGSLFDSTNPVGRFFN